MLNAKVVMSFIEERGLVNVPLIAHEFELTYEQAYKVLHRLQGAGKVLPVESALYGVPGKDGRVLYHRKDARAIDAQKAWYRADLESVTTYIADKLDVKAATVNEVKDALDFSNQKARKLLLMLVESGQLMTKVSRFGGSFGKKPGIYGLTGEDLDAREYEIKGIADASKKKTVKKRTTVTDFEGSNRPPVVKKSTTKSHVTKDGKVQFGEEW